MQRAGHQQLTTLLGGAQLCAGAEGGFLLAAAALVWAAALALHADLRRCAWRARVAAVGDAAAGCTRAIIGAHALAGPADLGLGAGALALAAVEPVVREVPGSACRGV